MDTGGVWISWSAVDAHYRGSNPRCRRCELASATHIRCYWLAWAVHSALAHIDNIVRGSIQFMEACPFGQTGWSKRLASNMTWRRTVSESSSRFNTTTSTATLPRPRPRTQLVTVVAACVGGSHHLVVAQHVRMCVSRERTMTRTISGTSDVNHLHVHG